jgi:hypothetical protein
MQNRGWWMHAKAADVNDAIRVAINLLHQPSQVRYVRSDLLPHGLDLLLRIAAGDEEAEYQTAAVMNRLRPEVREAAIFYIEQVLLYAGADSYRVLGGTSQTKATELRQNMLLLLRWLHLDADRGGEHQVFLSRVTTAWNDVKTPARRHTYDLAQPAMDDGISVAAKAHSGSRVRKRRSRRRLPTRRRMTGALRRVLMVLFARA